MLKLEALKEFRTIPGIGVEGAKDLWDLGFRTIDDLKNQDPEMLYHQHCLQKGQTVDRCVLYVFRCAVYYASHATHDPELLKWWNWKDNANTRKHKANGNS